MYTVYVRYICRTSLRVSLSLSLPFILSYLTLTGLDLQVLLVCRYWLAHTIVTRLH